MGDKRALKFFDDFIYSDFVVSIDSLKEIFCYPKIDEAARIIKHSAASEAAEEIIIKVLKQDKEILSQAEMTAFQAF